MTDIIEVTEDLIKEGGPAHALAALHSSAGKTTAHKNSGKANIVEEGETIGSSGTYAKPC